MPRLFNSATQPLPWPSWFVNPPTTVTITLSVEQISDVNFTPPVIPPLSRAAASIFDVELDLLELSDAGFDVFSIVWQVGTNVRVALADVGGDVNNLETFRIEAADFVTYSLGGHTLRFTIYKIGAPTVPFMINIPFRINN